MSQVRCPFCDSIQVKAMSNQPKKYPRPTDPSELADWQKGYDCKKCGNDFIVMPPKPKTPLSLLGKLIKYSLIFIIALIVISFFIEASKSPSETPEEEVAAEVIEPETIIEPEIEEDLLDQEFSQEAEEAAHTPYFDEPTSIENSADQNDTLSIKTTLRAKDE